MMGLEVETTEVEFTSNSFMIENLILEIHEQVMQYELSSHSTNRF